MQEAPQFGRWLKRLRADQDLTQEALAERVGCAPQTLRMFEGGQRRPSRELAERLADVLGVSAAERAEFLRIARTRTVADPTSATAQDAVRPSLRPSLPVPPTPLIGRQREQAEVTQRLSDPHSRLVTIVGPGGAGKTRLAIQVTTDLAPMFDDGAAFVSLASVLDVEGIAPAIAAALGYPLSGGATDEDEVLQFLRDRDLLLVLDNLEHLLDATEFMARIIEHAPGVRLLVTSRERLRVQAEWVIELGGLAVPHDSTATHIAHSEAVLLFVERARRMSGDFVLTPANQTVVAEICRRLDGLPLALELAAAQVSFLPPAALLQRLDHALPLLVDGARDLPPRQRTMRAAIEWSYNLLPADERTLFTRLAVFVGGFSLEAAEAVGTDEELGADQILRLLRRLVDQSLVVRDVNGADVRYRLLEPIRQFASERLTASESANAARDRHAVFFLALAEEADPHLQSPAQVEWLPRLEGELPNLRVAMVWLLGKSDLTAATRLCWGLWLFCWLRGHLSESRRWIEQILQHRDRLAPSVRARALVAALVIGFGQGAYAWAEQFVDEALTLYRTLQEPDGLAQSTAMAGLIAGGLRQYEIAEPLMEEGVQRYLAIDYAWGAAMLLTYWAAIPRHRGDYAKARRLTEQAFDLAQQGGDRVTMYSSLFNLASIAQAQGAYADALRQFRDALQLGVEVGDSGSIVPCLEGIAGVAAMQGDVAYAARLWGAAEALLERNEMAIYSYAPDRTQYAQTIEKGRRLLPPDRWAALWNEGRALSLDQAIATALRVDPVPVTAPMPASEDTGLRIAHTGETLTPRELDVLRLIAQGQRNRVIAERLVISEKTVQNHVSNIFAKLGVDDRSQAIVWAMQHGLTDREM
jgi:predicted ATPase/DNA-binding CsgD family transcriptional regulator/transcriptional regulator with XRE-family HTH domain